jgi:hypothetical protein
VIEQIISVWMERQSTTSLQSNKKNVIFEGGTRESSEREHHLNLVSDYQR